jgi:sugar phosphate isomerase/epimerase
LKVRDDSIEIAWQQNIKSIKEIIEFSKKIKLETCVENSSSQRSFLTTSDEFEYLIEVMPDIKFCFDIGHAFLNGFTNRKIVYFLNKYLDKIISIHLNDNKGDKDSHIAINDGIIDYKEILNMLKKSNYSYNLVIENHIGNIEDLEKIN